MINEQVMEDYIKYLNSFSGKQNSIRERMKTLKYFKKFLIKEELCIKDIETKDLDNFVIFLKSGEYRSNGSTRLVGPASIQQIVALLRTFFQYCFESHFVETHPDMIFTKVFKSRLPKIDTKLKEYFTIEEVQKLLDAASNQKKAMLYVMYNTMWRISTVLSLKLQDFDYDSKIMTSYESKNNVEVQANLSESTAYHLREYIEKFRYECDSDALFISKNRTPLTARSVQRYLKDLSLKILGRYLTPHYFRGIGITHMFEMDAKAHDVQRIVGHASINTTLRYKMNNPKHNRKIMEKNHPLLARETSVIREERITNTVRETRQEIAKARKDFLGILESTQDKFDKIFD